MAYAPLEMVSALRETRVLFAALISMHIPPYRDRPFRLNVTAYSG